MISQTNAPRVLRFYRIKSQKIDRSEKYPGAFYLACAHRIQARSELVCEAAYVRFAEIRHDGDEGMVKGYCRHAFIRGQVACAQGGTARSFPKVHRKTVTLVKSTGCIAAVEAARLRSPARKGRPSIGNKDEFVCQSGTTRQSRLERPRTEFLKLPACHQTD